MRDLLILIALCVVIVLAAWFLLPGTAHKFLNTAQATSQSTPAPNPAEPAEASKAAAKPKKSNTAQRVEEATARAVQPPSIVVASPLARPQAALNSTRVPAPQEVRIGSEGVDVIKTFGTPMASAYTVDSGHYFETYFYRGDRAQATIHLRDGKVYSVLSR